MRRALDLIALTIVLAGCDSTSPTDILEFGLVSIIPSSTVYSPGDNLTARFNNIGHRDIEMGICFTSLLSRRADGGWIQDRILNDVCPAVLVRVDGYSSISLGAHLPDDLAAGHYRLVKDFALSVDGYLTELHDLSDSFEVR